MLTGKRGFIAVLAALLAAGSIAFLVSDARSTDASTLNDMRRHSFIEAAGSLKIDARTNVDGKEWGVGKYTTSAGETCVELRSPQGWRAANCVPTSASSETLSAVNVGGVTAKYVYGLAAQDVESINVVMDDCGSRPAVVRSGVFLFVSQETEKDMGIQNISARGPSGQTLEKRDLSALDPSSAGQRPIC